MTIGLKELLDEKGIVVHHFYLVLVRNGTWKTLHLDGLASCMRRIPLARPRNWTKVDALLRQLNGRIFGTVEEADESRCFASISVAPMGSDKIDSMRETKGGTGFPRSGITSRDCCIPLVPTRCHSLFMNSGTYEMHLLCVEI